MKYIAYVPTLVCIAIAGYLVANGKGSWGWFLFVGALLTPTKLTHTKIRPTENED